MPTPAQTKAKAAHAKANAAGRKKSFINFLTEMHICGRAEHVQNAQLPRAFLSRETSNGKRGSIVKTTRPDADSPIANR